MGTLMLKTREHDGVAKCRSDEVSGDEISADEMS